VADLAGDAEAAGTHELRGYPNRVHHPGKAVMLQRGGREEKIRGTICNKVQCCVELSSRPARHLAPSPMDDVGIPCHLPGPGRWPHGRNVEPRIRRPRQRVKAKIIGRSLVGSGIAPQATCSARANGGTPVMPASRSSGTNAPRCQGAVSGSPGVAKSSNSAISGISVIASPRPRLSLFQLR